MVRKECTGRREALEKEKEHLRARNARMVLKIRDGVSRLMDLSTELKERKEEFRLLKKPLSRGP